MEVRLVELEPLRVASHYAFGEHPEGAAWAKLEAWARSKGYLDNSTHHRIFGFNNPSPQPGDQAYGYEFWITVGPEVEAEADVPIKTFGGGRYAVYRIPAIGDPFADIPKAWETLYHWCEAHGYRMGEHQWLEEHISAPELPAGKWTMDLYLPLAE
jgi:DNA gyrase inhibitor GyrI